MIFRCTAILLRVRRNDVARPTARFYDARYWLRFISSFARGAAPRWLMYRPASAMILAERGDAHAARAPLARALGGVQPPSQNAIDFDIAHALVTYRAFR